MKQIWKYTLAIGDFAIVAMPIGAEILLVANQRDEVCLWALVDPLAETEERTFRIIGTGHGSEGIDARSHIGSVLTMGGSLVWHVFEVAQ